MRVAIFGAGISGLTVAHCLSKLPGYQIDIYEAKDNIGGLARSSRDPDGCATEYCWRVYFGFYHNFLKILGEIPVNNGTKSSRDLLTVYKHINLGDEMSLHDKLIGGFSILKGLGACDERLESLDNESWYEGIGAVNSSSLFREIGPWLGMDREKGSLKSVIGIGMEQQIVPSYIDPSYKDYVTNRPTSEAIFDPWKELLVARGVRFHLREKLVSVDVEAGKVVGATTDKRVVDADKFVLSVPVEILEKVLVNSGSINADLIHLPNITKLRETCLHLQLSFQTYFDRKISLGGDNAFLLVQSPWDLIILSIDQAYDPNTPLCIDLPQARGGWSVAVCTAYIKGHHGKTFIESSLEEVYEELWYQLSSNKQLQALVEKNNGFALDKSIIVKWAPEWPTFYSKEGRLTTTEPKFTNNAGSWKIRPSFKTYIPNLFISTAYVKETIDIFSMEAACKSGVFVSNAIDPQIDPPIGLQRPLLFAPLRALDTICWKVGMPNVTIVLIIVILVYVVWKILHPNNG